MKLSVLALDYDGTIATDRGVDPDVRHAIAQARTSGITVLLVTGRILSELRRAAGDLHFVDGVVAENGAVVHFPDSDHTSILAPRLAEGVMKGLEKERIPFRAGECLADADAADGPRLLTVIRRLELPYVLVFIRMDASAWRRLLCHLAVGQAVALPITEEAGGELRLFNIGKRLTPHVRHRQKYVDVPVTEQKGFLFGSPGPARRARTLREFVTILETDGIDRLVPYLQRNDFSRWIGDVFGDRALAMEIRKQEERYVSGVDGEAIPEVVSAIRGRYDLTTNDEEELRREAVPVRAA